MYTLLKILSYLATAQCDACWSACCQSWQRGQGLSGSQQLLAYEILLFFSEQSLLLRAGMLAGDDVVEKYRFQWRNRETCCLEKAPWYFPRVKNVENWEMYKCIQHRGRDKLNETLADLERSDLPLGQWSLFSCKCQDYKGNLQKC